MQDFFHTDFITFNISHTITFIFLFSAMLIYFNMAEKYNTINESRKQSIIIRNGGIVFWLAGTLFSLAHLPQSLYFLTGLTLVCGISFWNDISARPIFMHLIIQFTAVGLILFNLDVFYQFPWWEILIAGIICIGIINTYHFMDGINGMTGLYNLVILGSLQYVNQHLISFVHPDFIIYAILACVTFCFFNVRNQAKCFAGNVGNIGIAFWIIVLLLMLIIETYDIIWVMFFAVYGVDIVCTIVHHIYLKQNIFKSHRLHFYQVWAEKTKCPQLCISAIYATIQLIICIIIIYFREKIPGVMLFSTLLSLLAALYVLKFQHDFNDIDEKETR